MLTKTDIKEIDNLLSKRLKIELKPIKSDLSKIRKGIDGIVSLFNREYVNL